MRNTFLIMLVICVCLLFYKDAFAFSCQMPKPATISETKTKISSQDIQRIAVSNKACSETKHGNRGKPPPGYLKGMALTFAKAVCRGDKDLPLIGPDKDALALYGVAGTLKNTYTLLIGLGMRESSGKYWEGIDQSAANFSSDTCEAGLFQSSYNSKRIIEKAGLQVPKPSNCFMPVWKEGIPIKSRPNYGKGAEGLQFQSDSKNCPSYAAEWAALTIRRGLGHYGPLKRREALFSLDCLEMLNEVEKAVRGSVGLCEAPTF